MTFHIHVPGLIPKALLSEAVPTTKHVLASLVHKSCQLETDE